MKLLFLCVANSARSQMAEALAKRIFGKDHQIESAGSAPANHVNPYALKVLKEIGIDASSHYPKAWDEFPEKFLNEVDYIITLCAEESCPIVKTKAKKLHWPLPDPAAAQGEEESLKAFRKIRDEIEVRLKKFKEEVK